MRTTTFNGYQVNLVETLEDIEVFKSRRSRAVGVDTETTGLDFTKDYIVGVCLSCGNPHQGYYFPLRHNITQYNLPIAVVMELVQDCIDNYTTYFWNRNFDACMLEKEGVVIPFVGKMHDVQVMAFLATGQTLQFLRLKDHATNYLKWQVIDFEDNKAKEHNFGSTDPAVSYVYAAGDPLMTVLLGQLYWKNYPYIQKIYPLDNKTVEAMRLIGKMDVRLDYKILEELLEDAETKLRALKERIFMIAGYDFNINSRIQVADALQRFVTLTEKTDKGQWKTDEEALMKLKGPNGETLPLASALVKYGEWNKYIGTYLRKMRNFEGNLVRINYNCVSTVTGRFSSGGVKGNPYYAPLNIQNIPKVETKMYIHPEPVIGYVLNEDPEGALGQAKTKSGLRAAFCAPKGRVWLTADYCISPESWVDTNFGRVQLKELPGKENVQILTPWGYKEVYNFRYTGVKRKCKLTLKSGEIIICSEDHVFLVKRGKVFLWVKLKDVLSSDIIWTQGMSTPFVNS